jgi:dihydrolipoamide dehydrogenase
LERKMNNQSKIFDLAIIGAGPGGYVAALYAAQLKAKVALIEKWEIGGVCLNVGCIPTKVLVSAAHTLETVRKGQSWGLKFEHLDLDFKQLTKRKELTVRKLTSGVKNLLKNNGVKLFSAEASFLNQQMLSLKYGDGKEEKLEAKKIIIATGSVAIKLPIPGNDLEGVIDSTGALELNEVPKSMVVIGGGYIGCEFASIYRAFGAEVTIVEMLPQILPGEDEEMVDSLRGILEKRGIRILTDSKVSQIVPCEANKKKLIVQTKENNKEILCDKVLVSVGRKAYTQGLNLNKVGIRNDKGQILVDKYLRTNLACVSAIGDCIGNYLLAHVASMEGEVAVENIILNKNKEVDYSSVPRCIFTIPELASIGISEKEAREKNIRIKVGKFPFLANGKAQAENETEGMVKIITDEKGKMIGGHILGNRATDLVAELTLGMKNRISAEDFIQTIHAHPTLPEAIREAFLKLENRPLHIL